MTLRVRWLGHASTVLDVDGVRLLTDPLLQRHAGLLRRRGAAPLAEDWEGADAVLLSHLHHDHAELGSLRLLGDVPVLTAPTNARWLRGHGVAGGHGLTDLEWWTVPGSDVRVRLVPAVHEHRQMPHRPNSTHGFVVATDDVRVWFAGDTAPFASMSIIPVLAGGPIDLALVPVGGWGPRLSGGHMDAVQAARACVAVGARVAVPVHWGTLHAPVSRRLPPGWMDRAGPAFAAAAARVAPGLDVRVVTPGEQITVDATR
ncbi:MBL fold metallo-hydrolase [Cellulomonas sp. ICMP 17802]|uniref:MBL fold metallo-hydrolase n=1 Tax=Cellulomonas sp. ICMP 17802 TaxID=3239199 RepID=UPI00351BE5D2